MKKFRQPFSLFAFQDIVTGLCGIVVLFVLIMVVDVCTRRSNPSAFPAPVEVQDDRTEELHMEIASLREELAEVKKSVESVIVATRDRAAPEVADKLSKELFEKERQTAALLSQLADLRTRVASAKDSDAESRKKIKEMEETRRLLEGKLAALKDKKGVTLIPERGEFKSPVYLVLGRGGVEMLRPLKKEVERNWFFFDECKGMLRSTLSKLDHTTHTVILLVRPSGIRKMNEIADMVRGIGFSCGRDPLEEEVEVSLAKANGGEP